MLPHPNDINTNLRHVVKNCYLVGQGGVDMSRRCNVTRTTDAAAAWQTVKGNKSATSDAAKTTVHVKLLWRGARDDAKKCVFLIRLTPPLRRRNACLRQDDGGGMTIVRPLTHLAS